MLWIGRLALIVGAMCIASGTALAQQTKLKWAHVYETSEPYHKWSVWAAAEIEKRTNGKYHIDVFPASSLGKESDINQGLTLGTVDIIISGLSFAARTMPRIGVGYYPYTFRDGDHLIKFSKSPVFKEMVDEFRNKTGIQITAMTYYGIRQTTTNKPFTDCAGMKGLKIRVPDVPAYLALPKSCGANPTPIAFAEVYLALQNGTVDAQENPLTTIEAKKFYEVQKNIVLTGHIVDSLATRDRAARLEQAERPGEADLHPGHAGSSGERDRGNHQAGDRTRRRVSQERPDGDRCRQEVVPGRGPEDRHASSRWATTNPTGKRSRRSSSVGPTLREWATPGESSARKRGSIVCEDNRFPLARERRRVFAL